MNDQDMTGGGADEGKGRVDHCTPGWQLIRPAPCAAWLGLGGWALFPDPSVHFLTE